MKDEPAALPLPGFLSMFRRSSYADLKRLEMLIMSQFDTLATDVAALTAQTQALKAAVAAGLADIADEIAKLKTAAPDISPQLAELEAAVADLGTTTGTVVAADPGPQA